MLKIAFALNEASKILRLEKPAAHRLSHRLLVFRLECNSTGSIISMWSSPSSDLRAPHSPQELIISYYRKTCSSSLIATLPRLSTWRQCNRIDNFNWPSSPSSGLRAPVRSQEADIKNSSLRRACGSLIASLPRLSTWGQCYRIDNSMSHRLVRLEGSNLSGGSH